MTSCRQIPAQDNGDTWRDGKVHLPHVDLVIAQACELRCIGCTNGMGMLPHLPIFKTDAVFQDIWDAAKAMSADKVCILGGEALLHKDLVPIMREARYSGLGDVVQVLTNGIALHRMTEAFWGELDWLKISIYPGKTPQENIDLAIRKQAEHGFELDYKPVADDPFRAVLTREVRPPGAAQATYERCWFKTYTRKIEQGFFWRCCTSPSISRTVLGLIPDADGLRLDGVTAEALAGFLARKEFMHSCTRCHGNLGPVLPVWAEERDRVKWLAASMK